MKVVKTVKEEFDALVETLPENTVMVDYSRVRKNSNGNFSAEDEEDNEVQAIVDGDIIAAKIGSQVKSELSCMAAGQEYDIITIIMPRQSVELLSFDEIDE